MEQDFGSGSLTLLIFVFADREHWRAIDCWFWVFVVFVENEDLPAGEVKSMSLDI